MLRSESALTTASQSFHLGVSLTDGLLVAALGVGAVVSTIVALLSVIAFVRRRTVSYLLIAVACLTVVGKIVSGVAFLSGTMRPGMHHSLEHSLDVVMMALVLVAVYVARAGEQRSVDT
jgi:hypothetical protein